MARKEIVSVFMTREQRLRERAASKERLEICLTNDYAFKKTFRNKKVLKGFLMALLGLRAEEIIEIEVADPHTEGEESDEKEGILDIKIHMNHDKKINIEMQVEAQTDWEERTLFYMCRMYTEGFERGEVYGNLETCIHVGVLDFNLMQSPGYHHQIQFMDKKTGEVYSDKMLFHVIELKKLKDADEEERKTELYRWANIISARSWEVVCMEANGNEYMEAAKEEMDKINQSEEERYLYLRREMAIRDRASQYRTAEMKGEARGEARGKALGEAQTKKVFQMSMRGSAAEEIAEACGITVERVGEILSEE